MLFGLKPLIKFNNKFGFICCIQAHDLCVTIEVQFERNSKRVHNDIVKCLFFESKQQFENFSKY